VFEEQLVFSAPLPTAIGGGAFVLPLIPQIANLVEWGFPRNICFLLVLGLLVLLLDGRMGQISG
jgi:hypothetical protein